MALPININDLIYQRTVEQNRIEYKEGWNPEPIIHSISAFANDFDNMGGGYIIMGIEEENGRPVFPIKGLDPDSLDEIQLDLLNKCNFIEPRYIPIIEPAVVDGKDIIVLWIPGGEERPYKAPEKVYTEKGGEKSNKAYYIRKGSRTIKANAREEQELISMARDIPFDDRINYHANVDDMRPALMADYLKSVGSDLYDSALNRSVEAVGTDMHIVSGPTEYRKPLNVGLMFFNERPDNYFSYARIEVVDKPEPTGHGMTEKIFTGPLDKQLNDALSYIKNYIIKEYVTKVQGQAEAVRVYNWPYEAVEEALSNAVYHKSYQIHEPITVTITPEKLEILSIPGPDRSITDEDLKRRVLISKRYRNRRIGDFLKELNIVEGRNTGVPLIVDSMQENGNGLPEFSTDEDRSFFLVTMPIHPVFLENSLSGKDKTTVSSSADVEKGTVRRSKAEIRNLIVKTLEKDGNQSMNELATALGYAKLTNTLRDVVNEMIETGKVGYLYPDSPRSRKQKICLKR
ncbi:MAG: putative DNA binding domain-containing protein [Lachnospiraceae bacterium]|nr:putative DNA binding domain-containing protein [Lachnospiraceae bacterium]